MSTGTPYFDPAINAEAGTTTRTAALDFPQESIHDVLIHARSICVRGVNFYYGQGETRSQVLFDNRLDIGRGEVVIMTGPSGSGKTTLLTLIGGLRSRAREACSSMTVSSWERRASPRGAPPTDRVHLPAP